MFKSTVSANFDNVMIVPCSNDFVKSGPTRVASLKRVNVHPTCRTSHGVGTCEGPMCIRYASSSSMQQRSELSFDSVTCTQRSFGSFWRGSNNGPVLSFLRNNCGQLCTIRFFISLENQIDGVEFAFQDILVAWSPVSRRRLLWLQSVSSASWQTSTCLRCPLSSRMRCRIESGVSLQMSASSIHQSACSLALPWTQYQHQERHGT